MKEDQLGFDLLSGPPEALRLEESHGARNADPSSARNADASDAGNGAAGSGAGAGAGEGGRQRGPAGAVKASPAAVGAGTSKATAAATVTPTAKGSGAAGKGSGAAKGSSAAKAAGAAGAGWAGGVTDCPFTRLTQLRLQTCLSLCYWLICCHYQCRIGRWRCRWRACIRGGCVCVGGGLGRGVSHAVVPGAGPVRQQGYLAQVGGWCGDGWGCGWVGGEVCGCWCLCGCLHGCRRPPLPHTRPHSLTPTHPHPHRHCYPHMFNPHPPPSPSHPSQRPGCPPVPHLPAPRSHSQPHTHLTQSQHTPISLTPRSDLDACLCLSSPLLAPGPGAPDGAPLLPVEFSDSAVATVRDLSFAPVPEGASVAVSDNAVSVSALVEAWIDFEGPVPETFAHVYPGTTPHRGAKRARASGAAEGAGGRETTRVGLLRGRLVRGGRGGGCVGGNV